MSKNIDDRIEPQEGFFGRMGLRIKGFVVMLAMMVITGHIKAYEIILVAICLLVLFASGWQLGWRIVEELNRQPIPEQVAHRIEDMEKSIAGLRNTQALLTKMRDDLEASNKLREEIEQDLARAKKLKGISDEEVSALVEVMHRKSWGDMIYGFLSGVAVSVTGFYVRKGIRFARQKIRPKASVENLPPKE